MEMLLLLQLNRLVVVDSDGCVEGIVSLSDILRRLVLSTSDGSQTGEYDSSSLRGSDVICRNTVLPQDSVKTFSDFWSLSSSRHDLNYDDCLEDNRENYQNCSVLCCVRQLYTDMHTHEQCWFRFIFCTFVYV